MTSESTEDTHLERQRYNEELQLKMERFFEEECRVFSPDDPGLIALEEALRNSDLKVYLYLTTRRNGHRLIVICIVAGSITAHVVPT